jgi:hypothetical protein
MPTLLIWRGYRFRFYAADGAEPPHVHVVKDGRTAKISLRSLELASQRGYTEQELRQLAEIAGRHREEWLGAWNEFFGL